MILISKRKKICFINFSTFWTELQSNFPPITLLRKFAKNNADKIQYKLLNVLVDCPKEAVRNPNCVWSPSLARHSIRSPTVLLWIIYNASFKRLLLQSEL